MRNRKFYVRSLDFHDQMIIFRTNEFLLQITFKIIFWVLDWRRFRTGDTLWQSCPGPDRPESPNVGPAGDPDLRKK